jgi:hypothetical protein
LSFGHDHRREVAVRMKMRDENRVVHGRPTESGD